jgi:hypothetical protein
MAKKLYVILAETVEAYHNCVKHGTTAWMQTHREVLEDRVKCYMPSGSGIDSGTTLNIEKSTGEKLVFETSYHHMDENGMYDGWTNHVVTVRGSLAHGLNIQIGGENRNQIKDYLHDVFRDALMTESFRKSVRSY